MKLRETTTQLDNSCLLKAEIISGFFGDRGEGNEVLNRMGLPSDTLPFDIDDFISKRCASWLDADGLVAEVIFDITPIQIECFGFYKGEKKSMRVFREWGNDECPEMIQVLESEAIGDLCMRCLYELII